MTLALRKLVSGHHLLCLTTLAHFWANGWVLMYHCAPEWLTEKTKLQITGALFCFLSFSGSVSIWRERLFCKRAPGKVNAVSRDTYLSVFPSHTVTHCYTFTYDSDQIRGTILYEIIPLVSHFFPTSCLIHDLLSLFVSQLQRPAERQIWADHAATLKS